MDSTTTPMPIIFAWATPGPWTWRARHLAGPCADMAPPVPAALSRSGKSRRRKDTAVSETVVTVAGMTCGHCVNAVQGEIGKLPGVTGVEVDLETGAVRITADPPPDRAALSAAVDEAGYELTG